MKHFFIRPIPFGVIMLLAICCKPAYQTSALSYNNYRISAAKPGTHSLETMLKPYSDSVNKRMNDTIGVVATLLEKKQPESTLGNIMADAMLIRSSAIFNQKVDVALINYGGVRLNQIVPGPLTRGKVYELMPFDNVVILQSLSGQQLQQLLNHIAARGGWPIAGASFIISNKTAAGITINGKPLDLSAQYTVANTDYIVNGGDDIGFLKQLPRADKGYLLRDALIEYFSSFRPQGKNISVHLDNRVTNAQ